VPVAAGGPTDIVARMLAEKLSAMWGQTVFIENKAGAGTNIGNEYAARSDPDGYTILFTGSSLASTSTSSRSRPPVWLLLRSTNRSDGNLYSCRQRARAR
jgi:tripartite-type tricarboxylate transporter receptor subunit TctC